MIVLKILYVQGQLKGESPTQREALHKGRVRNIARANEIIKYGLEGTWLSDLPSVVAGMQEE